MEKLTAGQCSVFVEQAVARCQAPEVLLLAYVVDTLVQECTDLAGQLADRQAEVNQLHADLGRMSERYAQLQYLAMARAKDA